MLDNISLNYGSEYLVFGEDSYIINTTSHVVYYLKGVTYEGVVYYTLGDYPTVTLEKNS